MSDWISIDAALPDRLHSVIVWGTLEDESESAAHEGFIWDKQWKSVRSDEQENRLRLHSVTHWRPFPPAPRPPREKL